MKLYNDTKLLYTETDKSGVGLRAGLLQIRDGTSCQRDDIPDNNIIRPITFAGERLSAAGKKI